MRKGVVSDITLIALFAAFISVCSFITVPFFAVPFTLQSLGIFSALFILGGARGTLAVTLYVVIGATGLPVFSGFTGGVGRFFDATGGFIIGFIVSALSYWIITAIAGKSAPIMIIGAVAAQFTVYICGWLWFSLVYSGGGLVGALTAVVLPFIIPDAL